MKLFVTPRNFYLSTFKGRDCWVKKFFDKIDVNILTPTTFLHGEPGYMYLIFCTIAIPKLDDVVGEEVWLKLLLALSIATVPLDVALLIMQ